MRSAALLAVLALVACKARDAGSDPTVAGGVDLGRVGPKFPLVKLHLAANGELKACSGVFITKNHILTAAHCLSDARTNRRLPLGAVSVASHFVGVERFEIDDAYNDTRLGKNERFKHDLGVVVVRQPADEDGPDVYPVSDGPPEAGAWVELLGYGLTVQGSSDLPETPRRGWNRVEKVDDAFIVFPTPTTVNRAGDVANEDAATRSGSLQGDSGGPLLQNGKVVGICSGGQSGIGTGWISIRDSRNYYVNLHGTFGRAFLARLPPAPERRPDDE